LSEIDFVTALGRLLDNPALRQAFRADPVMVVHGLAVREDDREALEKLAPDDLEFQASILLRKRLETIQRRLPVMCSRLDERLWDTFVNYSQSERAPENASSNDVPGFAEYVARVEPKAKCQSELNRTRFAAGRRRFGLQFTNDLALAGRARFGLQIFLRGSRGIWQEWTLSWGTGSRPALNERQSSP